MKNTLSLIFAVVLLNGCTQWKDFTGANHHDAEPEDIHGTWTGDIDTPDWGPGQLPRTQKLTLVVVQGNTHIITGSVVGTEGGHMFIAVSGSINGRDINMVSGASVNCPNLWTFSGNVAAGGLMTLKIDGDGNSYGACYDHPIHQTIYLAR